MRKEVRATLPDVQRGLIEIPSDRKETLGPEEPAVRYLRQPARAKRARKLAAHHLDRIGMIDRPVALAAAGFVISGEYGDPFQQSGFAGPVFTDDDRDRPVEIQFEGSPQKSKAERLSRGGGDARRLEPDAPQIRRRHIDRSISF